MKKISLSVSKKKKKSDGPTPCVNNKIISKLIVVYVGDDDDGTTFRIYIRFIHFNFSISIESFDFFFIII